MSTTTHPVTVPDAFDAVVVDLYLSIHKAIRSELFAVTVSAGRTDPADRLAKSDLARHITEIASMLEHHAEHEDGAIQPLLEVHLPALAEQIALDHLTFDAQIDRIVERAMEVCDLTGPMVRRQVDGLYLDLAAFTSSYLVHQDLEERQVMPALHQVLGVEATLGVHQQIIGSIPPDELARTVAVMLPAMNVDDRAELLGGMQASAPAEVFDEFWGLASSVLHPADTDAVARRLGL